MQRILRMYHLWLIPLLLLSFIGCGTIFKSIMVEEGQSENYALMEGTEVTAPQMIDGNLKTSGQSVFPEGSQMVYGSSVFSEAVVILPEEKFINRIVVYSTNLKTFDIMADVGNGWRIIKEIKGVAQNPTVARVSVHTDRIKIRVKVTTSDAVVRRQRRAAGNFGRFYRGNRRAPAEIQEIQLYGPAEKSVSYKAEKKSDELDELLLLK